MTSICAFLNCTILALKIDVLRLYCHLAVPYFVRPRPILTGPGCGERRWPASCLSIIFVLIVFCGWGNIIENIDRLTGGIQQNLFFPIEEKLIRSMLWLFKSFSILWITSFRQTRSYWLKIFETNIMQNSRSIVKLIVFNYKHFCFCTARQLKIQKS